MAKRFFVECYLNLDEFCDIVIGRMLDKFGFGSQLDSHKACAFIRQIQIVTGFLTDEDVYKVMRRLKKSNLVRVIGRNKIELPA